MKTIILAALMGGLSALSAHAESYTFNAHGGVDNAIQVTGMDGKPIGGAFLSGTSVTTMASGKTINGAYKCEFHSALPGGIFDQLGVCTVTDDVGSFYQLVGCNPTNKDGTEMDCWAGLRGTAGLYAGKGGSGSWHSRPSVDGKTGVAFGQGAWNP